LKQRGLIRRQIVSAWEDCIAKHYSVQQINSERSLQAAFWSHLIPQLSNARRVFIEPSILLASGRRVFPDVVVTNSREVIAVVELKYTPKGTAKWQKDLATLAALAGARGELGISHTRHRGTDNDREHYRLSKHVLFVWAGVHKAFNEGVDYFAADYPLLQDCYLQLHAETFANKPPELSYVVPSK
jgi:hypothetical protein